ncbi:MAG: ABC transporter ATP-binding protein [Candidatus Odinarchaeota archaeon]|nr:ABC transporter ATP-binding protein [Candidatus Odinarchaeota archaeon]
MIIAENVYKEYGSGRSLIEALHDINLRVYEGEFLVVVGPSGSGKTTLLNILSGLDKPTKGRVLLDGIDLISIDENFLPAIRREKVGFIFQDFNLINNMTALENVMAPILVSEMKRSKVLEKATDLIRQIGLIDRKDHLPKHMSGGEQQRVAIARALVNDPKVVFADEPTGNLDTTTGAEIMKLLRDINRSRGTTFIVVTHEEKLIKYGDRIVYLEDGRIKRIETKKK